MKFLHITRTGITVSSNKVSLEVENFQSTHFQMLKKDKTIVMVRMTLGSSFCYLRCLNPTLLTFNSMWTDHVCKEGTRQTVDGVVIKQIFRT